MLLVPPRHLGAPVPSELCFGTCLSPALLAPAAQLTRVFATHPCSTARDTRMRTATVTALQALAGDTGMCSHFTPPCSPRWALGGDEARMWTQVLLNSHVSPCGTRVHSVHNRNLPASGSQILKPLYPKRPESLAKPDISSEKSQKFLYGQDLSAQFISNQHLKMRGVVLLLQLAFRSSLQTYLFQKTHL